jgi:hypothetical protein
MSNVIPLPKPIRDIADILNEPFDDDDEDFRNPLAFMRRHTDEILRAIKHALPDSKDIPEADEVSLVELARLAGCTPDEIAHFVETTKPTRGAKAREMPPTEYGLGIRAYFCDRVDDGGQRIGVLIAAPFGMSRWRLFDLPLSLYRTAFDAVYAREAKTWAEFVQSVDEFLVGVVPDEFAAQAALREFSPDGTKTYENIIAAAGVNFKLCVRGMANSVVLFRLASLARGRALGDTMQTMTTIHHEGGAQLAGQDRAIGSRTGSNPGALGHIERAD